MKHKQLSVGGLVHGLERLTIVYTNNYFKKRKRNTLMGLELQ